MSKAKSNNVAVEAEVPSNATPLKPTPRKKAGKYDAAGGGVVTETTAAIAAALVVFGRDDGGKPHASWFGAADAELAIKAAGMMSYRVLPINSDEHRAAASGLAAGRVFASGRAFTPFCKEGAYTALATFPDSYQPPAPVLPEPEPTPVATGTPQRWEDVVVGSLVLASEEPQAGWFEAIITEDRGEALFVLRWRDFLDHDAFVRRADCLALLPAAP